MVFAIIVAAGKGERLKGAVRKQYLSLHGRPVLTHTIDAFLSCSTLRRILLVVPEQDFDFIRKSILPDLPADPRIDLVPGGAERQDSVFNGLREIGDVQGVVVIHDGVRPFVRAHQIMACAEGAVKFGACILGIPVQDTLKHIDHTGRVRETLSRDRVWGVQTPQAFRLELIKSAHEIARQNRVYGTDDAFLVEKTGMPVMIMEGSPLNIKITTRDDLLLAEAILKIWR